MDIDIERFRAMSGTCQLPRAEPRGLPRHKKGEWFLKGPIPGNWLSQAARLPGKSLHVGLAIWYIAGIERCRRVKLTKQRRELFGIGPDSTRRGLQQLEVAGLVSVVRASGCSPAVTILDLDDSAD